jgi:predicted TIM-barrel fold metal-dependent hydrolase
VPGLPPFVADFLLDTTRAAYRLVQSGVPRRFPNLKIILSHGAASFRMRATVSASAC